MTSLTICIDAGCVIRRVAFPEDTRIQQAWDHWEQNHCKFLAPTLLYYELTNVFHRYQRLNWLSKETVEIALAAALALPVEPVWDMQLHWEAKAAAERYQLSAAYDAHYLALAERQGSDFWTTDERLVKQLRPHALPWVKWMGEFQP